MEWRLFFWINEVVICKVSGSVEIIPGGPFNNDPVGIMSWGKARVTNKPVGLFESPINGGSYRLRPLRPRLFLEVDLLLLELRDECSLSSVVSVSLPFVEFFLEVRLVLFF